MPRQVQLRALHLADIRLFVQFAELKLTTTDRCSARNCTCLGIVKLSFSYCSVLYTFISVSVLNYCLTCFDTVGWALGVPSVL